MILKMTLKAIILFCIFSQGVFASEVQNSSLGSWETSWDELPVELQKQIISYTKRPYFLGEINQYFYSLSQTFVEKHWDLEYKFPLIFEEYLEKLDKKEEDESMPIFIKNMCEEYDTILNSGNFSHPLFEKRLPFFVYHSCQYSGGLDLHCTRKKIRTFNSNSVKPSDNFLFVNNTFFLYGDIIDLDNDENMKAVEKEMKKHKNHRDKLVLLKNQETV